MLKLKTIQLSRNSSGFTLIELLVVISVIGILTSIIAGAVFAALKTAKKKAAQSKCDHIASGITSLLTERKSFKRPLLEKVGSLNTSDPFSLADRIWIDWELNPQNQYWFNLLDVGGTPYFPIVNKMFKHGVPATKRNEIASYILKDYVEFKGKEIMPDPGSGSNPRAFDPWYRNTYKYVCYYQAGSSGGVTFLVDGVVSFGADGEVETISPTPYPLPENPFFNPEGSDKSTDNTWTLIDQYLQ